MNGAGPYATGPPLACPCMPTSASWAPTTSSVSKNLFRQRDTHTLSPLFSSPSRYGSWMHLTPHCSTDLHQSRHARDTDVLSKDEVHHFYLLLELDDRCRRRLLPTSATKPAHSESGDQIGNFPFRQQPTLSEWHKVCAHRIIQGHRANNGTNLFCNQIRL